MGHSPRFAFSRLLLGFRRRPVVGTRGRWGTLLLIVGIFSAAHAQTQPRQRKKFNFLQSPYQLLFHLTWRRPRRELFLPALV